MWFVFSENPFARRSSVKCSGNFNGRHKASYVCLCARGFNFTFIAVWRPGLCFPCCQLPCSHSRPLGSYVLRVVLGRMGRYGGQEAPPASPPASDCPQRGETAGVHTSGFRTQRVSCLILSLESVWDWTSRAGVHSEMEVQWEERELCGPPRNSRLW